MANETELSDLNTTLEPNGRTRSLCSYSVERNLCFNRANGRINSPMLSSSGLGGGGMLRVMGVQIHARLCKERVIGRYTASKLRMVNTGLFSTNQRGPDPERMAPVRTEWTRDEVGEIYNSPLLELIFRAASIHRVYWDSREVQQCTLISIKTGGCTEDCKYCSQSTRNKTFVKPTPQMKVEEILQAAQRAKDAGSTRFCMGAAWRELGGKKNAFKHILEMVRGVNGMGLEVCTTLGMLTLDQARQLKEAGLSAYNHNLDTSPEFYPSVITTRTYEDRLQTIANVRDAGISLCCGGILGLGEEESDRVGLLHTLATLPKHPESVPINALVVVEGTPIGDSEIEGSGAGGAGQPAIWDMARAIATARILMPRSMVRLSAGRLGYTDGEQALLFMAGANSIFTGDVLLTTPNPEFSRDDTLFKVLGLRGKPANAPPMVDEEGGINEHKAPQNVVVTQHYAQKQQHE